MHTLTIFKLIGLLIVVDYIRLNLFQTSNKTRDSTNDNGRKQYNYDNDANNFKMQDEFGNDVKINTGTENAPSRLEDIKENVHVKILYCSSWGYKNHFDELRRAFLSSYTNVEVTGDYYPIGFKKEMICYILYAIQFFVLFIIFFPDQARANLTFIPSNIIDLFVEKKWASAIVVYLVGNSIIGGLKSSSAFEVIVNGNIIFSKLQTGAVPQFSDLIRLIKRDGINLL